MFVSEWLNLFLNYPICCSVLSSAIAYRDRMHGKHSGWDYQTQTLAFSCGFISFNFWCFTLWKTSSLKNVGKKAGSALSKAVLYERGMQSQLFFFPWYFPFSLTEEKLHIAPLSVSQGQTDTQNVPLGQSAGWSFELVWVIMLSRALQVSHDALAPHYRGGVRMPEKGEL